MSRNIYLHPLDTTLSRRQNHGEEPNSGGGTSMLQSQAETTRIHHTAAPEISLIDQENERYDTIDVSSIDGPHPRCDHCGLFDPEQAYCNACGYIFCPTCWANQIVHRKALRRSEPRPHEETGYSIAGKIRRIFNSAAVQDHQSALCDSDEDAAWLGIIKNASKRFAVCDYGRMDEIISRTVPPELDSSQKMPRYPSLVSFIGATGAGKSTLIRLMIDFNNPDSRPILAPTPGIKLSQDFAPIDVELFLDPGTASTTTPIVYAECEEYEARPLKPGVQRRNISPRSPRSPRSPKPPRSAGPLQSPQGSPLEASAKKSAVTSEYEIKWATTQAKQSFQFMTTHLYSRFLYAFSDVVVYVVKDSSSIEDIFESLVNWATTAFEGCSNQPMLPHAILVLNLAEPQSDSYLWDPKTTTSLFMETMSTALLHSTAFTKYAKFWQDRHRKVGTPFELLQSYYSSISVIRVPVPDRPNLLIEQIGKLQDEIYLACATSRERKDVLRMLLTADEFQMYLQLAISHFSSSLDSPFDFVKAASPSATIPQGFGGNILKLAICIMKVWENEATGEMIFTELSYMVASCLMLYSARNDMNGSVHEIFTQYLDHIDLALETFCNQHWPCEYIQPGGGARCVNVRYSHSAKGHQLTNGKLLTSGRYVSRFSFANHCQQFRSNIFERLQLLLDILRVCTQEDQDPVQHVAAKIHRDNVLRPFYQHCSKDRWDAFISHSACLFCLFGTADHALPCGHVLCSPCLEAFGHHNLDDTIAVYGCPMEMPRKSSEQKWIFHIKPNAASIRILTLDGGGIRGIVELEILRQLEQALGGIAIQCLFDLIVGTSTGGIIALGLAAKEWPVHHCNYHFETLCKQAFTRRVGSSIPGVRWLVDNHYFSKYETQPLEEALTGAFSNDECLFGGLRTNQTCIYGSKVAVTATSMAGKAAVLANYNRPCNEKLPYHFQRAEDPRSELKVWEAARATSAAPRIFKPMSHEPSNQIYIDGGVYHNNPIQIADKERKLLWPELANRFPDIIISIGTSYGPELNQDVTGPAISPMRGVYNHGKQLIKIAKDHISYGLDSERAWDTYMDVLHPPASHRPRFVRLNAQLDHDPPQLDEVSQMKKLQEDVHDKFRDNPRIHKVANQLIATSFYFERSGDIQALPNGALRCKGFIRCRLPSNSDEMSKLGLLFKNQSNLHFVIQEQHREQFAETAMISLHTIEQMISHRTFSMGKIKATLSNQSAMTEILLCFGRDESHPISKFPRCLYEDEHSASSTKQVPHRAAARSRAWSDRGGQQAQRQEWIAPDPNTLPARADTISRYSEPDYIIGGSTSNSLRIAADLLTNGPSPDMAEAEACFELEGTPVTAIDLSNPNFN